MNKTKRIIGDSAIVKKQKGREQQLSKLHEAIKNNHNKNIQTLLLRGERTEFFVTEDSRKYISKEQQYKKSIKYDYIDSRGYFDSLHFRYVRTYSAGELQQKRIVSEFRNVRDIASSFRMALKFDMSPMRMWQVSLAGAVLFGMVSMNMIYKNLGQNAFAKSVGEAVSGTNDRIAELVVQRDQDHNLEKEIEEKSDAKKPKEKNTDKSNIKKEELPEKTIEDKKDKTVVVDSVQKNTSSEVERDDKEIEKKVNKTDLKKDEKIQSVDSVQKKQSEQAKDEVEAEVEVEYSLKHEAEEMVEGYPIEKMLPYILQQDPEVAKYLIAIAKQESQWGKRVPVLNGQDCYNYWGFRGKRKLMGSGGHTCFNSRKDAVETVGRRIHELIYKYDRTTAKRLIVWKCGSTCEGHSQAGVDRWIGTVNSYYSKLSK